MKSLLWKDYRINRLLLIFGFVVCVGPWVITIARHMQLNIRGEGVWWGPEPWVSTSSISLVLSLFTLAMLGGNAIAAERADRSAEFLAYMPVSRWTILAGKSLIALTPAVAIWMVNLAFLFWVAPRLAEGVSAAEMVRRPEVHEFFDVFGPVSVLLFGAGWFWSAVLHSHGLATGMSFFTLAVVVFGMIGIEYGLDVEGFFTNESVATVFLIVGIGGYIAGCAYYLRRLEP
jgi:ABC-type Na+ efflux pump permease subunit